MTVVGDEHTRESLARLEGKMDGLATQLVVLQVAVATDRASLAVRIATLEKAGDRRWSLLPTWVTSGVALAVAVAPYVVR